MKARRVYLTMTAVVLVVLSSVSANAPRLLNYQGRLTDLSGTPLNGTYSMTFRIYDAAAGGNLAWSETHPAVAVNGGLFEVLLGSVTQLYDTTFADTGRWVSLQVGTDPELTPLTRLATSAYSFRTASVDGATGGTISGTVDIQEGVILVGAAGSNLTVKTTGNGGVIIPSPGSSGTSLFLGTETGGRIQFDIENSEKMRIDNSGNVGIGTSSPSTELEVVGDLTVSGNIIGSTPWTAFPFAAGFDNYEDAHPGSFQTVQYRKIGDIVYLRGTIHKADHASIPHGATLGTLPFGFRPPAYVGFASLFGYFEISPSGDIKSLSAGAEYQYLDVITFSTTP